MASYNAVAPPGMPAAPEPAAAAELTGPDGGPPTAQQRLAALKAKLSDARTKNHKEVVAEDRRNKLGPEALKKERAEKAYEKAKEAGALPSAHDKLMGATAEAADEALAKKEKKEKRRGEYGWDIFNNEAQYRHHKKLVRRAGEAGRVGAAVVAELEESGAAAADADPLAYGDAPPVSKERVQALVDDMHEAALRRASWSRRRTFDEARDVTYINKRNEVYNKKIERAFDPYTAEIRANLERGTAL